MGTKDGEVFVKRAIFVFYFFRELINFANASWAFSERGSIESALVAWSDLGECSEMG